MAIFEINLEKPALVEEYQYPGETTVGQTKPGESSRGEPSRGGSSSGGGKAKLLGLLAVVAGVGLLAWKLKTRSSSGQSDLEDFETDEQSQEYEHGPEPEIGGDEGGAKRKVASALGLVVALVGVVAAVRKARS